MKKIALISANNYQDPYPIYPIGISYIATYLKDKLPDWQLDIFDFNLGGHADLALFCQRGKYDYIGVSLRNVDDTNYYEQYCFVDHYRQVMQTIRQNSNAVVLMGGSGFSVFPDVLFNELGPDWGIQGEGEESICKLLSALEKNEDPTGIDGLVYRKADGTVGINEHKQYISSLAFHVEPETAHYYFDKSGMLNIQTKRGCPYGCIYCSYPNIEGPRVRLLDPASVVENIKELYYSKGVDYLFFTDSVFNIHREYNRELATRLIESKVHVKWGAYFTPYNLTYQDLELYQKAGLKHIEWGTDSLSDIQLENYNKSFRFSDIKQQSLNASQLGIFHAHFMILGGYGETDQTLDQTFERSRELGLTLFFPFVGMRIYPRTRLYQIALEEGVIKPSDDLLKPVYYLSKDVDISSIKDRALACGQRWIFPGFGSQEVIDRFRAKKKRGPLWEYLMY